MTFYEMLEQVMALLKRHGRLSYRALKVQFEFAQFIAVCRRSKEVSMSTSSHRRGSRRCRR